MSYVFFLVLFLESYFVMELKPKSGRQVTSLKMLGVLGTDEQDLQTEAVPFLLCHFAEQRWLFI